MDEVLLATIGDFATRCGAARLTVVAGGLLVQAEEGDLTIADGEESYLVAPGALAGAEPVHVHAPKPLPATALEVDALAGQVSAPIGWVDALVVALIDLAGLLGEGAVVAADFTTRDGSVFTVAARPGEPPVLAVGEEQFELPEPR